MWLHAFLRLLPGVIIGAVAAFVVCSRKSQLITAALQTTSALAEQRRGDGELQLAQEKQQTQTLRDALASVDRDLASTCARFVAPAETPGGAAVTAAVDHDPWGRICGHGR